ncbi:hypothetical protein V0M98_32750 (plasmid) [Pseudomonas silesiensis]|uniref:hypothetical protein n=1 Tax=Pseudomonas silesiensis TaxID=1853130 RepID=UPI0030D3CB3F
MSNLQNDPEYLKAKGELQVSIDDLHVVIRRSFRRLLIVQSLAMLLITVATFAGVWLSSAP